MQIHYTVRSTFRHDRAACGALTIQGRPHSGVWCEPCWAEARRRYWPALEATERGDVVPERVRAWVNQPLPTGWPQ